LLSFVLAPAFTGWAFRSNRGRRLAYVAYALFFVVISFFFVMGMGWILERGVLDPFAVFFLVLFIAAIALGVYGYRTRPRKPSVTAAEQTVVQSESPDAPS
jgi:hypothetical protein